MDGVAKHTAGMSRVKHIRAMSQKPANLRFLNKIRLFIKFSPANLFSYSCFRIDLGA